MDVSQKNQVKHTIRDILDHFGKVDILINSAGVPGQTNQHSHLVKSDDLQKVFDINFTGSWLMSKYLIPQMIKNGYRRILQIASIARKESNAVMLAYSASQAAVIGMTQVQVKKN